jgi:hypothetical protein
VELLARRLQELTRRVTQLQPGTDQLREQVRGEVIAPDDEGTSGFEGSSRDEIG